MTLPPRRRGPPRALATTSAAAAITNVVALYDLSAGLRSQRIYTEWADLVGERIAARTRPIGVLERALVIEVASSAWMHELTLLRLQLLAGLTERLGQPRLFDELRFRLAGRDRPATAAPTAPRRAARPTKPLPPPAVGASREQIDREAAAVDDLELRALIARVRTKYDR